MELTCKVITDISTHANAIVPVHKVLQAALQPQNRQQVRQQVWQKPEPLGTSVRDLRRSDQVRRSMQLWCLGQNETVKQGKREQEREREGERESLHHFSHLGLI